jgi:hypothetical protein
VVVCCLGLIIIEVKEVREVKGVKRQYPLALGCKDSDFFSFSTQKGIFFALSLGISVFFV